MLKKTNSYVKNIHISFCICISVHNRNLFRVIVVTQVNQVQTQVMVHEAGKELKDARVKRETVSREGWDTYLCNRIVCAKVKKTPKEMCML